MFLLPSPSCATPGRGKAATVHGGFLSHHFSTTFRALRSMRCRDACPEPRGRAGGLVLVSHGCTALAGVCTARGPRPGLARVAVHWTRGRATLALGPPGSSAYTANTAAGNTAGVPHPAQEGEDKPGATAHWLRSSRPMGAPSPGSLGVRWATTVLSGVERVLLLRIQACVCQLPCQLPASGPASSSCILGSQVWWLCVACGDQMRAPGS